MVGQAPVSECTQPGVAELLFEVDGCGGLKEFAEAGAGVGEAPGGNLDPKTVECG